MHGPLPYLDENFAANAFGALLELTESSSPIYGSNVPNPLTIS